MKITELRAWVYTRKQLSDALGNEDISLVYCPIRLIDKSLENDKERIIVSPPEYLADCEEKVKQRLKELYDSGFRLAVAHTVGHIELLKAVGFSVFGGNRLNCANSNTANYLKAEGLEDIILSPELTVKRINSISSEIKRGILAYGYLPLMINRRCPINNGKPCNTKNCGRKITDRLGNKLDVICYQNMVEILNSEPLILSDRLRDFDIDYSVLRFTVEAEINPIISAYKNGDKMDIKKFTRGLYYRGVE